MKKLFLAIASVMTAMSMNAQTMADSTNGANNFNQFNQIPSSNANDYKPEEGSFMMEIGFAPFHTIANDSVDGGLINLQGGLLRGVYVATENLEIKLGLGFSIFKDVNDNGQSGDAWHKTTDRTTLFSVNPGVSYVFDGTDKLSPYVGGELEFGITSTKNTDESEHNKTVTKNENGFNTFGVAAVSGFNFYFAKNIFIGAEVKLGVEMQIDKKPSVEADGKTTKTETKSHDLVFQPQAVPTLRLGWAF